MNENYLRHDNNKISGNNINFDLDELTNNFNFYDYCSDAKYGEGDKDACAFLVISDNQCILGYNSNFGDGGHIFSFALVDNLIYHSGRNISKYDEVMKYAKELSSRCITARIIYNKNKNSINSHQSSSSGYMNFDLMNKKISSDQFKMFEKFYEKYNEDLEYVCKKFNFKIYFYYRKNEKLFCDENINLDDVYEYMKNNIDYNKEKYDEKILSCSAIKKEDLDQKNL